eukprot:8857370-Ditylum_brightwellii.AAC.1
MPNELDKVTTEENITRSYHIREFEHAKEGAMAYKNYFARNNVDVLEENDSSNHLEHFVENCWTSPPRSVYSRHTHTTHLFSGITDPKSAKLDVPNDTLQEIPTCTDAVEKAYHTERSSLLKLQEETKALMEHNSLENDLAQLCEQSEQISAKTEEFKDWKQRFKESEKKMKKRFEKHEEKIDEKFQQ